MDKSIEPDEADTVEGESLTDMVARLLPGPGTDLDRWGIQELQALALLGRLSGDISGAVSAHRVLQDALGSLRGGYAEKRRADQDLSEEEADAVILEAAKAIRAKRQKAGKSRVKSDISPASS